MELNNRRTLGTSLALSLAAALLTQCPNKSPAPHPTPSSPTSTVAPDETLRTVIDRFFKDSTEEGPKVDLSQYLDEDGNLKPDFSPASAVADCIKANSRNFGPSNDAGTHLIFPERIESDPEGAFPIKILDDGNRWMWYQQNGRVSMSIVSGSGRLTYDLDLHDPAGTASQVKTACEDGLEELEVSHVPEDFCSDDKDGNLKQTLEAIEWDISLRERVCEGTQARWTSYAEMGQNFRITNGQLRTSLAGLGFDSVTQEGDFFRVEDGPETVNIKVVIYDNPGFSEDANMGYLVVHKGENDITNQITLPNRDLALDYVIDPQGFESEQRWNYSY